MMHSRRSFERDELCVCCERTLDVRQPSPSRSKTGGIPRKLHCNNNNRASLQRGHDVRPEAGGRLPTPCHSLLLFSGAGGHAALVIVLMELIGARGWAAGVLQECEAGERARGR